MKTFGKHNWWILILFGLIGQIAWSVENMYFNLFVFDTIAPSLETVTLMVQCSGIVATVATLIAGTFSDKRGNRRAFISWGYIIWGVTVALFGAISNENIAVILNSEPAKIVGVTLVLVVVADCIMTLFGSTANDASFNAWVTDNTEAHFRGRVESVLAVLPMFAMLIVAGGFGILVELLGYATLFGLLGIIITACGILGLFIIKDSPTLEKSGTFKDIIFGFKPTVIRSNKPFYLALIIVMVYGIACQIFMPYLIIYMKTFLNFSVIEYSVVFGAAIIVGAIINIFLGRLSDKKDKNTLLYFAATIMAVGLFGMFLFREGSKMTLLLGFGIAGFIMITGYIFVSALCGSIVRDHTPLGAVGKLQGIRMVFSVLIPMLIGPMIGNDINKAKNIPLPDLDSADVMTTQYIPAPEIFLAGAVCTLFIFVFIPFLSKVSKNKEVCDVTEN